MQTYAHHLGRSFTFGIKNIKGIAEIGEELIARVEALGGGEAHIIVIKGVGNHQMRSTVVMHPVR